MIRRVIDSQRHWPNYRLRDTLHRETFIERDVHQSQRPSRGVRSLFFLLFVYCYFDIEPKIFETKLNKLGLFKNVVVPLFIVLHFIYIIDSCFLNILTIKKKF